MCSHVPQRPSLQPKRTSWPAAWAALASLMPSTPSTDFPPGHTRLMDRALQHRRKRTSHVRTRVRRASISSPRSRPWNVRIGRVLFVSLLNSFCFSEKGEILSKPRRNQLNNKLSHAQHLDESFGPPRTGTGGCRQIDAAAVVRRSPSTPHGERASVRGEGESGIVHGAKCIAVLNGVA